jgi:polyferredoxin
MCNVCPTGIDIRNGTQLECVNCTVSMMWCNNGSVGLPKRLIRYASEDEIEKKSLSNSQQEWKDIPLFWPF